MPTPTPQPLEQAFGSPVPAHSVLLSFGSSSSDDVFCCSKFAEMNSHCGPSFSAVAGLSVASALSVRHTPPFVVAIHSVHSSGAGLQSGEMTPCAVRPPKFSVPVV